MCGRVQAGPWGCRRRGAGGQSEPDQPSLSRLEELTSLRLSPLSFSSSRGLEAGAGTLRSLSSVLTGWKSPTSFWLSLWYLCLF